MNQSSCYNCFSAHEGVGPCPYCGYDPTMDAEKYPFALPHGSILAGQYITGRVLGQGGFGITYLALDKRLNLKVAIKEFLPDTMAVRANHSAQITVYTGQRQENFQYGMERFLDEARVLAKFQDNPNIVGVRSYFEENGTAYFVMDYIEGISFKNYIQNQGGKISWQEAANVLIPVMDALAAVHREGIIHRDVTPDNIFLTSDGGVRLLDFGSARYSLGDKSRSLDVVLKAGYAPKEQYIRRGKQGPYTDVYSLGACFYAAITGYLPPEALERLDEEALVAPSTRGIKLPWGVEDVLIHALEVQAADRYQTMDEFRTALDSALEESEESVATPIKTEVSLPEASPVASEETQITPAAEKKFFVLTRAMKGGLAIAACCAVVVGALAWSGTLAERKETYSSGGGAGLSEPPIQTMDDVAPQDDEAEKVDSDPEESEEEPGTPEESEEEPGTPEEAGDDEAASVPEAEAEPSEAATEPKVPATKPTEAQKPVVPQKPEVTKPPAEPEELKKELPQESTPNTQPVKESPAQIPAQEKKKVFSVSQTNLEISSKATIYITAEPDGELIVRGGYDGSVIQVNFGAMNNDVTPLYITPISNGSTSLVLANGYNDEELLVNVTVSGFQEKINKIFKIDKTRLEINEPATIYAILDADGGHVNAEWFAGALFDVTFGEFSGNKIPIFITPIANGAGTIHFTNTLNNEEIFVYVTVYGQ